MHIYMHIDDPHAWIHAYIHAYRRTYMPKDLHGPRAIMYRRVPMYMHAYIRICQSICMGQKPYSSLHMPTYIHTYMHACIHTHMYACIHTYQKICMGQKPYFSLHMPTCVCTYINLFAFELAAKFSRQGENPVQPRLCNAKNPIFKRLKTGFSLRPRSSPANSNAISFTCMHVCIHTYTHVCMHTYIPEDLHRSKPIPQRAYAYIHTYIYTHIHTCIHTYAHVCMHTYIPEDLHGSKSTILSVPRSRVLSCHVYMYI
jgi:hypothetical protein